MSVTPRKKQLTSFKINEISKAIILENKVVNVKHDNKVLQTKGGKHTLNTPPYVLRNVARSNRCLNSASNKDILMLLVLTAARTRLRENVIIVPPRKGLINPCNWW